MAALQGEMCSRVVVKRRRNPPLGIVAVRTRCLPTLRKLAVMSIFVTILTDLGRTLELHFFLPYRHLVASAALHGAVRPQQRELGFRMVESIHVGP